MMTPAIAPESLPRTTVQLWHFRLVDLRTALEATIKQVSYDSPQCDTRVVLDLCLAELKRVNFALEVAVAGWDIEEGNPHAAACRAEGLLP
jgi:hypothetical protein